MMPLSISQVASMVGGAISGSFSDAGEELSQQASLSAVVTDSRKVTAGSLFVALPGERTDGHDHLASAVRSGAAAALISDIDRARAHFLAQGMEKEARSFPLIDVDDTVAALGVLAREYLALLRRRATQRGSQLTVLGVTGSVGKTTTKDLTRQVLAAQGPTVAPVASFNNEIGLPLTVLEADEHTRYLVLEMGASGPGHISYLTEIAPLDAAAVLMVGHAHMGGFGSIEGVARAKAEIIEGLVSTGTAVLNIDDPRVAAMAPLAPGRVVTFSRRPFALNRQAPTVFADQIRLDEDAHPVIDLGMPGMGVGGLRLGVQGEHNVANALAAAALAYAVGIRPDRIVPALSRATVESPHRLATTIVNWPTCTTDVPGEIAQGELLVIDDSYNANLDSMTASLATLPALAGRRRRVVIISEMLELGEASDTDHACTGELVAQAGAQVLVTIGAGAHPCAQAAQSAGVRTIELPDAQAALDLLDSPSSPLRSGDAVLLKGSHGSGAWRVANHLTADPKEGTAR